MSQQAQAQGFQDRANSLLIAAQTDAAELLRKLEASEITQESFDTELAAFDARLEGITRLTSSAKSLSTAGENLAGVQAPRAVHSHPQADGAQNAPPRSAVARNLSAVAEAQFDGRGIDHLEPGQVQEIARMAGVSSRKFSMLSGADRALMDRFIRGEKIPRQHQLSERQIDYLSRDRVAQLMDHGEDGPHELATGGAFNLTPFIDRSGGLATSHEFRNEVIGYLRDTRHIRRRANVIATNAMSMSVPTRKLKASMAHTVAGMTNVEPTGLRDLLGKKTFTPHEKTIIIQAPEQLVEDLEFDLLGFVSGEIAEEAFEDEERQFLSGTGSGEPFGVLTALAGTAQIIDHTGAASSSAFTPEDVKNLHTYLRPVYLNGATYMMSRAAWRQILGFRDDSGAAPGTGSFLFQPSMTAGETFTLSGFPVDLSEFFPDNMDGAVGGGTAEGDPLVMLGNWRNYWVVERLSMSLQMLVEKYADENLIGWKFRKRLDAAPVRVDSWVALGRTA